MTKNTNPMDTTFENFTAKSIKLGKDQSGVIVTGEVGSPDKVGNQTQFKELTRNAIPHQDFLKAMNAFKTMLLAACGYSKTNIKKLTSNLEMIGISLSGTEENEGAILSGKLSVPGGKIALNTPRIVFSHDVIGIESTVEDLVEDLKVEAHGYLFEDKRSDPELFEEPKVVEMQKAA